MTKLTNEAFKSLLEGILDTKAASVIDAEIEHLALFTWNEPPPSSATPTPRQEEILYQVYEASTLDVKWLIAAYHLGDDEKYTAITQWLIQKGRANTIPDLGDPYNFEG